MRWLLITVPCFILVTVVGVWYPSVVLQSCTTVGSYCMYPFLYAQATLIKPYYDLCGSLKSYRDLMHDYHELQETLHELQGSYIELASSVSYASDVDKELTWFKKRFDSSTALVVPVMGIHRSDRQHTMLIEGGSAKGIERDMVVLADNLLVGKVVTVYPWYAVVQLITDPVSCVSVYGVSSGAHGIVRGTGAQDTLYLERVDHLSPVQEKELLLTSGDGLVVPRGYGVGVVETYSSDGLYYTGTVKMMHDIGHLKTCLVVNRANLLKISCLPL